MELCSCWCKILQPTGPTADHFGTLPHLSGPRPCTVRPGHLSTDQRSEHHGGSMEGARRGWHWTDGPVLVTDGEIDV